MIQFYNDWYILRDITYFDFFENTEIRQVVVQKFIDNKDDTMTPTTDGLVYAQRVSEWDQIACEAALRKAIIDRESSDT